MNTIKQTLQLIKKKPLLLVIPFFFDLFAMALFGYTLADVRMRALNIVANLNSLLQRSVNTTMEVLNQSNIVESFSQQTDLVSFEWALIKLLIFLLVVFWLVWVVFQGGSWRYASIIAEKKPKYFKFMGRFFLVNLIWLSCLTLINFFILSHQFGIQVELHRTALDVVTVLAIFLNFVVAYFMFISYSLLANNKFKNIIKKTFKIGIYKAHKVVWSYLVILIGFVLIDLILRIPGWINKSVIFITEKFVWVNITTTNETNQVFVFILGIFLLLPYITIARVYLIKRLSKLN